MIETLRELEKGHEAKFKLDQETQFKISCRRNKLLGLWAAQRMGLTETEAKAYALELVKAAMREHAANYDIQTVVNDLRSHGLTIDERDVAKVRDQFQAEAWADILGRFPTALASDHSPVGG